MWRRRKFRKKTAGRGRSLKLFKIILIPLVFVIITFFIFKSDLFSIKKVDVEGDKLGCAEFDQLKDISGLYGQNFFALNKGRLAATLKERFICIKNVQLSETFPNKVKIIVSGRQPVAILATLKEKLASAEATPSAQDIADLSLIDDEGVAFSKDVQNLDLPKVFTLKDPNKNFLQILDKIKILGIIVKDSSINDNLFIINTEPFGPKIIFQLNNQIDIQLASLQLILDKAKIDSSKLEFIDLRFDKPVVRFAPQKKN